MKPIILVLPLYDYEKDSMWMLPGYMDGISEAGGIPIMPSINSSKEDILELLEKCDGVLFTGGHDVSPSVYGEELTYTKEISPERDILEGIVLEYAIKNKLAVLGICRGIQFINAYLKGTLYQDLVLEGKCEINHIMTSPYDRGVHDVEIVEDSLLYDILKKKTIAVNSYHHQAVKKISPMLQPAGYSPDGVVEALYMKDTPFFLCVQWHPEFSYKTNDESKMIFKAFVDGAKK